MCLVRKNGKCWEREGRGHEQHPRKEEEGGRIWGVVKKKKLEVQRWNSTKDKVARI